VVGDAGVGEVHSKTVIEPLAAPRNHLAYFHATYRDHLSQSAAKTSSSSTREYRKTRATGPAPSSAPVSSSPTTPC
jgi:hypothetical protein